LICFLWHNSIIFERYSELVLLGKKKPPRSLRGGSTVGLLVHLIFFFLCGSASAAFLSFEMQEEDEVRGHHHQIDAVKQHHYIAAVQQLVCDARDIADHENQQKQPAFPFCGVVSDRFHDIDRPRRAKTRQHDRFKYTDSHTTGQ
jgi:hypothetical protein